ncbi:hypothetical protein BGW38_001792 [Lunasporangiospora selenospora]|uniref:Ion transport domain-containing protein n=1 Tax=Lunasporangiospora selenospora TaxID=979761 RepID=A0A9P6G145_9FUNG|nr:hypothetical protein BGW38_001792 [Lunasporangiospora selenospora]
MVLAELRVSENVCKYITMVFGIIHEIKVFFMVLAASMIFFTIAIVHVIHGAVSDSERPSDASLPKDFLGALSTVYLLMGGWYDPLNKDMYIDGEEGIMGAYKNGLLLLMVMVYFTFSSVLMLNVLIALINSAFVKADDSWRQVWLENRLQYIESAENMSYHIPGFRNTFDWFPETIYYTATQYQVKQYWRRVTKKDEEIIFDDNQYLLGHETGENSNGNTRTHRGDPQTHGEISAASTDADKSQAIYAELKVEMSDITRDIHAILAALQQIQDQS